MASKLTLGLLSVYHQSRTHQKFSLPAQVLVCHVLPLVQVARTIYCTVLEKGSQENRSKLFFEFHKPRLLSCNDLVFKLQKSYRLKLCGLRHQSTICLKFPHKRRSYKFRNVVSWGGCTGSVGQRPPNRFKQKRIYLAEILSSKGQKNDYKLGGFHMEHELGAE